jgi:hypothetical protein
MFGCFQDDVQEITLKWYFHLGNKMDIFVGETKQWNHEHKRLNKSYSASVDKQQQYLKVPRGFEL